MLGTTRKGNALDLPANHHVNSPTVNRHTLGPDQIISPNMNPQGSLHMNREGWPLRKDLFIPLHLHKPQANSSSNNSISMDRMNETDWTDELW